MKESVTEVFLNDLHVDFVQCVRHTRDGEGKTAPTLPRTGKYLSDNWLYLQK